MQTQTRQLWLNLILLLLTLGLGGWAWWYAQRPPAAPQNLTTLPRETITRVVITRNAQDGKPETLQLERQAGQWYMTAPHRWPLNPVRLSQLFTLLDETVETRYDATGKDLQGYGLEPAVTRLQLNDQTFVFGIDNPVSHKRYILHDGKLSLVSEAVYGLLTGEAVALAANTPVPPGSPLAKVDLPAGYAPQQASGLVQDWQAASAIRVQVAGKSPASRGKIVLTLANGNRITLDLLTTEGELLLGNAELGLQYVFPETQRQQLLPKP